MHDVGKPRAKRGEGQNCTFYGHQVVGAKMAERILERLRFSKSVTEAVTLLVREHMFVYDPEVVTLRGVRRLINRVGIENMDELIKLREADRSYVSEDEAKKVVDFIREKNKNLESENQDIIDEQQTGIETVENYLNNENEEGDDLFDEAIRVVSEAKKASASLLHLRKHNCPECVLA